MTDWTNCPAVECNPRKISGSWAFIGTRVPVYALFENLEAGRNRATVSGVVSGGQGVAGNGGAQARGGIPQDACLTVKILFDHGTPAPLRRHLPEHSVDRSAERGWELLENGELLRRAEADGYEVIVTTDQNIRHQQNLTDLRLAIIVLLTPAWPRVRHRTDEIQRAIEESKPGEVREVPI